MTEKVPRPSDILKGLPDDVREIAFDLLCSFRNAKVLGDRTGYAEFVLDDWDSAFILSTCKDREEVICKMFEFMSRHLSQYNKHNNHLAEFNDFFGTHFTNYDMEKIYEELGHTIDRDLTLRFIRRGYDMSILEALE